MDRATLIKTVQSLTAKTTAIMADKALSLEKEESARSELYYWCREQMLLIHQMKHQFLQEVSGLHQEAARLNQETRQQIEKLRRGPCPANITTNEVQMPMQEIHSEESHL